MRVSWLYSNSYGLEAIAIAIIPIAFLVLCFFILRVWRFYIKFGVFILSSASFILKLFKLEYA